MRAIPDPGFPGDDGSAPRDLTTALEEFERDPERSYWPALAVLQDARVLVPVVAVLGEVQHDEAGLVHDKTSDMAAVLVRGQDGRTALLAFTGSESMRCWNADARPVPVSFRHAVRAARQQGAAAVVVDLAGPVLFAVEGADLDALAGGQRLSAIQDRWAWTRQV